MIATRGFHADSRRPRRAITLVEAVISIVLVGGLLLVALDTFGSVATAQSQSGDQGRAQLLALSLMSEIMSGSYADLTVPGTEFGPEPGEAGGTRALFNDIDDYSTWSESPLMDRNGVTLTDLSDGWWRGVSIRYVLPNNLAQTTPNDQGIKRIIVTVARDGLVGATLTAVRTGKPVGPSKFIIVDPEPIVLTSQ